MKLLVTLVCGAVCLALPAWADPLAISASGRGATAEAAIAAAKKQVTVDAKSAGLKRDGYCIAETRVIEVARTGSTYVALVEANLIKEMEPRRIAIVISGEESQVPRLTAIVQRLRSTLAEAGQVQVGITEVTGTGALRIKSMTDLQRKGVAEELERIGGELQAEMVYVLTANSESEPVFLVGTRPSGDARKTIRTLRDSASGGALPLSMQVTDAVRQDMGLVLKKSGTQTILTLPLPDKQVYKGQSVLIYNDRANAEGLKEATIVTHGVITEVTTSTVRVVTDDPLSQDKSIKWRMTPASARSKSPQRGVVIKESDW